MRAFVIVSITILAIGCNITPPNPTVPPEITVPAGQKLVFTATVDGFNGGLAVQIYQCDSLAPGKYGWVFVGPEADLYNKSGQKIGKHYKSTGPTWELSKDGSKVIGKKSKETRAVEPNAVPWLLLEAVGHEGSGDFGSVTWLHRVDTKGGSTPTDTCDKSMLGQVKRVPYQATYYFYAAK